MAAAAPLPLVGVIVLFVDWCAFSQKTKSRQALATVGCSEIKQVRKPLIHYGFFASDSVNLHETYDYPKPCETAAFGHVHAVDEGRRANVLVAGPHRTDSLNPRKWIEQNDCTGCALDRIGD